jgi:CRISPR/Cas system-associated exonuclease Cas4 (RecB family)
MSPKMIRASDIATFLYCQRAWYYTQTNAPRDNEPLLLGSDWHDRIERQSRRSTQLMRMGTLLLLGGIALAFLSYLRNP